MIIFSFCIFIWILMRSSSNIASIMLKFMRSCWTSRIRLKTSIMRSIDSWISASIARFRRSQRSSWSSSLSSRIRLSTKFNQTRSQRSKTSSSSSSRCALFAKRNIIRTSEHREQFNLKRDRDQFGEKLNDRNSKRKRENDDDERLNSKIDDEEKKHKIYIVISSEILTIMSVMFRQVAYWALNTICSQHNVRNRSTFIFYTTFSKLISVNDLKNSTIAMRQSIVKLFCKINNKRMNISFSNAFYVFECSFNLINFDQLNDRCSMTYKSEMFIVEN
jgi:hypothetical protein